MYYIKTYHFTVAKFNPSRANEIRHAVSVNSFVVNFYKEISHVNRTKLMRKDRIFYKIMRYITRLFAVLSYATHSPFPLPPKKLILICIYGIDCFI